MVNLDDVIAVKHLIVCGYCAIAMNNQCDAIFTSMNDWLLHKEITGHKKDSHSVAIVGGTKIDEVDFEIVHSFDRI